MQTFKDHKGRSWTLHIDVNAIRRVRLLVGVDLMKATEGALLQELSDDICRLVDVLYAVLAPQCQSADVSDIDFGEAMIGDALDAGLTALLEDLVGFFRQGERKMLATFLSKMNRVYEARTKLAISRMEAIDLDQILSQAEKDAGGPSTNSPAS